MREKKREREGGEGVRGTIQRKQGHNSERRRGRWERRRKRRRQRADRGIRDNRGRREFEICQSCD